MDKEMLALANAFLRSGSQATQERFNVDRSDEQVVITITRTNLEPVKKGLRRLAEQQSLVPYGSGTICGACGGTGRL